MLNVSLPLSHRKIIRGASNPLDKATIVSIMPRIVDEIKPTLQPSRWIIQPGSYEHPSILVVGPSSWYHDINEESPILEIPVSAIQIAESIVNDYTIGIIEANLADKRPGLFFIPGELSVDEIKKNHKIKLDNANKLQRNWYARLVTVADSLWARTNGNPLAISDDMRIAAQELGHSDKPWIKDFSTVSLSKCFACGNLRNPEYPVCPTCKSIDLQHPKAKELKFAV